MGNVGLTHTRDFTLTLLFTLSTSVGPVPFLLFNLCHFNWAPSRDTSVADSVAFNQPIYFHFYKEKQKTFLV